MSSIPVVYQQHVLLVMPSGNCCCLSYQTELAACHTKWDLLFVIPNGTCCLSYQIGLANCHIKWQMLFVISNLTCCLSYQMGIAACHTKWDMLLVIPNRTFVCHSEQDSSHTMRFYIVQYISFSVLLTEMMLYFTVIVLQVCKCVISSKETACILPLLGSRYICTQLYQHEYFVIKDKNQR